MPCVLQELVRKRNCDRSQERNFDHDDNGTIAITGQHAAQAPRAPAADPERGDERRNGQQRKPRVEPRTAESGRTAEAELQRSRPFFEGA